MDFTGHTALVTGAGSGIGRATALRLARDGARVAVLDFLPERASAVAAEIGPAALPLAADVADAGQMRAAFQALSEWSRLTLIVANAGINGHWAPIDELTPEEWDRTANTNLRGTYLTLHLGVPLLKAAGGGAVVVVSSINGTSIVSSGGATSYSAAKAGQQAMATQLALELARHRIRVNTVCPGQTVTAIGQNTWQRHTSAAAFPVVFPEGEIPLTGGIPARPEDIADAICLLLSDEARHVSGATLTVDGGQSLIR